MLGIIKFFDLTRFDEILESFIVLFKHNISIGSIYEQKRENIIFFVPDTVSDLLDL
jgi:hypothetical protein